MKKIAAILLVGILVFNSVGYRALNSLMQHKASLQLVSELDRNQYDASQLISVKIPATHLPYSNNSTIFERVDGQIEINGVLCQYVKCRLFNDSLELLCIPNQKVMQLRMTGKDHFKFITDLEQTQDSYIITHILQMKERGFTFLKQRHRLPADLPFTQLPTDERPPDHQA